MSIEPTNKHLSVEIKTNGRRTQASEDSEQLETELENGETSSSRAGQQNDRDGNEFAYQLNGHYDPKRRKIYLFLLSFSIFNALVGLALILTWMLKYRPVTGFGISNSGQLSNLHVLFMFSFMVSLNMYAVLIYRTHYSQRKQQLKWAHATLTGLTMSMSLLGVAAMYKSHLMANIPNFYSLHSWIGVLTNVIYVSQFSVAFLTFLKPGLSSVELRAKLLPWHRLIGISLVMMAGLAAITGIAEMVIFQDRNTQAYSSFSPITFIANFAGISVLLVTATTVYMLTDRQYLRPALPEEMAIKR